MFYFYSSYNKTILKKHRHDGIGKLNALDTGTISHTATGQSAADKKINSDRRKERWCIAQHRRKVHGWYGVTTRPVETDYQSKSPEYSLCSKTDVTGLPYHLVQLVSFLCFSTLSTGALFQHKQTLRLLFFQ